MTVKKISMAVLALTSALVIPFSSVSASEKDQITSAITLPKASTSEVSPMGAGEWDYLGYDYFTSSSKSFYSGGGDFKFCITSGPTGWYSLYEDDESGNPDEWIGTWYLNAGSCVTVYSIGGYVDGDNKKAEFQVRKNFGGTAKVDVWD